MKPPSGRTGSEAHGSLQAHLPGVVVHYRGVVVQRREVVVRHEGADLQRGQGRLQELRGSHCDRRVLPSRPWPNEGAAMRALSSRTKPLSARSALVFPAVGVRWLIASIPPQRGRPDSGRPNHFGTENPFWTRNGPGTDGEVSSLVQIWRPSGCSRRRHPRDREAA